MELSDVYSVSKIEQLTDHLMGQSIDLGLSILKAIVIFFIGKFIIKQINRLVKRLLNRKDIVPGVRSFVASLVNIVLIILLITSIISALGIQTTSFAALVASAGVAVGIALSGNLSNFAGGIIILLFRPIKVGDYISTEETEGTVKEIKIFHTVLDTLENITVYIPNGKLSSGYIKNYNVKQRRIEWIFGVEYGEDFEKVKTAIQKALAKDARILANPEPFIDVHQLDSSSVNIVVRVWVKGSDYWNVYFNINKQVYNTFNKEGINFPFPQLTVHQG